MLPVGFEPTISAGERPQTYALDLAATGAVYICCRSGVGVFCLYFLSKKATVIIERTDLLVVRFSELCIL